MLLVVSVAGTTELGSIDPIDRVQCLLDDWREKKGVHIWHHVDAAYGGFLCALQDRAAQTLSSEAAAALQALKLADSVTLDPHKLGYVPYSSGVFLARTSSEYATRPFGGPYLQFDPSHDKGLYTIEGSRAATGAAATWMTAGTIGLNSEGYGRILARTVLTKRELEQRLVESGLGIRIAPSTDTNVLAFCVATPGDPLSVSNVRTERVCSQMSPESRGRFIVSKTRLPWSAYGNYLERFTSSWNASIDTSELVLVRMCMMNPFFSSIEMDADFHSQFIEELAKSIRKNGFGS